MMRPILRGAAIGALAIAAQAADISFYMLSISWAPNYCLETEGPKHPRLCGPDQRLGFVVSGLSAHNAQGVPQARCGPPKPVAPEILRSMVGHMPVEAIARNAWAVHGACTGLEPADYFSLVRRLRDSLRLPRELEDVREAIRIAPQSLGTQFAQANPGIPRAGFRVSCYASALLENVQVCFDKNGIARPCEGIPECTKLVIGIAPMRPPRTR